MKRVVITGIGCVSPYGIGVESLWRGLSEGRSAIGEIPWLLEAKTQYHNGGGLLDYLPDTYFSAAEQMLFDRATQFALLACAEAWRQAGLALTETEAARTAVYIGTAVGGSDALDAVYRDLYRDDCLTLPPLTVPRAMANAAASHIGLRYKLCGPSLTISTACASSTQAIGEAFRLLRYGAIHAAVAGGTDACLNPLVWRAWESIRAMAPDTCRPFSRGRRGMVLGEGAGVLVMETLESAHARGATILAEVLGYSANCDAGDIVKPSKIGAARAMAEALQDAELPIAEIDYVNAHGTGTLLNDRVETAAIRQVLGTQADRIVASSVKSAIGHLMGAAGAVELIAGLMTFKRGLVPPTMNYQEADPECDLDCAPNAPRSQRVNAMLKNSFAFGGLNTSLVLRNPEVAT
jgi:nodulation protein E